MKDKLIALVKNLLETSPINVLSLWVAWLFVALDEAQAREDMAERHRAAAALSARTWKRNCYDARACRDDFYEIGWEAIVQRNSLAEDLRLGQDASWTLSREIEQTREMQLMADSRATEAERLLAASEALVHGVRTALECPVGSNVILWAKASFHQMKDENLALQKQVAKLDTQSARSANDREQAVARATEAERILANIRKESKCPANNDLFCWLMNGIGKRDTIGKRATKLFHEHAAEKTRADVAEGCVKELESMLAGGADRVCPFAKCDGSGHVEIVVEQQGPGAEPAECQPCQCYVADVEREVEFIDAITPSVQVHTPSSEEVKACGEAFEASAVYLPRPKVAPCDQCAACGKAHGLGRAIKADGVTHAVCSACFCKPWCDTKHAIQARLDADSFPGPMPDGPESRVGDDA